MSFEWDEATRRENVAKHRIEFADAVTAFADDNAITVPDEKSDEEDSVHNLGDGRAGSSPRDRLLMAWRDDSIDFGSTGNSARAEDY